MVIWLPRLRALTAGAILVVIACAGAKASSTFEDPCVNYLPGRFSEFLVGEDGSVVLFPEAHDGTVRVWRDSQWHEVSTLATEGIVRDAIDVDPGRWLLVSQVSQGEVALYEYSGAKLRLAGRLSGKFERPTLHRAGDGSMWVTSAEGRIYGLKDGKSFTREFGAEVNKKGGSYTYYPPTVSLDVTNRGLWFWSLIQHEALDFGGRANPAIDGFQVYQDGDWRVVSLGGRKLGGAVLRDPNTIIAGSRYKGMLSVGAKDGEVREIDCQLPPDEHCLFLHRAPAGHLLLITARPSMFMRLAPVHGGWLGQLLVWKDGEVRTLLKGVDFKRFFTDKGRAVADVGEGTFLAEAQSGLLFVSSDLDTVRRLDWRYGVPLPNIDRLRCRGQQLYALDRERGFAIIDYPKLLWTSEHPSSKNWAVFGSASPSAVASDGSVWYLTADEPAALSHWVGTNETRISLEGSEFPVKSLWYLTTDTRDRLWLISNFETHRTALLDGGQWRTFDRRETAYSTVALEEAGHPEYRLGSPADHCYPVFAGDGRVAYQNEWSRICAFDGTKWDAEYVEGKIDGRSPEGPPFYRKGVLTVRAGGMYYEHLNGKWQLTHADVRSPYGDNPRRSEVRDIPKSFPGDAARCSIRIRDNQETLWIGDSTALWRGLHDVWVPFAVQNSPLCLASGVTGIQADGSGAIWFALGGGDYTRLARYQAGGSRPRLEWAETPKSQIDTASFACSLRIIGSCATYIVRRQLDNGEWRQASIAESIPVVGLDGVPNGIHTIRVQVFDELLRASDVLEHQFAVSRNYAKEVETWMPLLLSSDYAQRECAARALVAIGQPALPALKALGDNREVSVQWWVLAVKEEIERQR